MRLVALAFALLLASDVAAQPEDPAGDYDVASEAWNGLSELARLARGLGLEVEARTELSWNELGPGDVLVVLYPTSPLDPGDVTGFLHNGGRLLIGDDFGQASAALGQLGLVRSPAAFAAATEYHEGDQDLPVARALVADHPLTLGVGGLTCNHPALFSESAPGTAVFGFSAGEAVVAAGPYGAGRFVALADPSVLINRMLELEDNLAFARNTLGFLARPGPGGRILITTGAVSLSGEPTRALSDQPPVGHLLSRFNGWLDELNLWTLQPAGMRAIAVLLALVGALAIRRLLPAARKDAFSGSWTRVGGPDLQPSPAEVVAAVDRPGTGHSFLLPAAMLRDTVNRRLGALLGIDDPLVSLSEQDLRRAVASRAGAQAAAALAALIPLLRRLPTQAQAATPWAFAPLGRREFDRIAAATDRLYRSLGQAPAAAGPPDPASLR